MSTFGDRHGFNPDRPPIRYRNEAPMVLRESLLSIVENIIGGSGIALAVFVREKLPAEIPAADMPIKASAQEALRTCPWYKVYEIAEEIRAWLRHRSGPNVKGPAMIFEKALNELFWREGIGWKMDGAHIVARYDDSGESSIAAAQVALKTAGLATSAAELIKAQEDISRRPIPDVSGAIQHLGAAIECTMREICGDQVLTMGELLKRYPNRFPQAIKPAVTSIWAYSSEMGRHLREGREPEFAEAVLLLEMTAAAINYLLSTRERS
jgi:hypothetical protein